MRRGGETSPPFGFLSAMSEARVLSISRAGIAVPKPPLLDRDPGRMRPPVISVLLISPFASDHRVLQDVCKNWSWDLFCAYDCAEALELTLRAGCELTGAVDPNRVVRIPAHDVLPFENLSPHPDPGSHQEVGGHSSISYVRV